MDFSYQVRVGNAIGGIVEECAKEGEEEWIAANGEQIAGSGWRHSFDCAVLVFWRWRKRGLNAEGAEEARRVR